MIDRILVWLATACLMMAGAVAAASNVVRINYDAAGNIVAIERVHVAPIALAGSSSATEAAGAIVSIKDTVTSTGRLASIDTRGNGIAQVKAPDGAASAAALQLIAR